MAASMNGVWKRFFHVCRPLQNTNDAFITRTRRTTYVRTYPVTLVQPDGSTFTIRYHEPKQAITLPLRLEELSPEEQRLVLLNRKPREKVKEVEEFKIGFHARKYLKHVASKKKQS